MTSPQSIYYLICNQERNVQDIPAILAPGKQSLSFRNLSTHLHAITLQLTRMGFRPGDRLAVVLPNGPEMATAFLAISAVCTCAPLNPSLLYEDYKFCFEDFHIKALVVAQGMDNVSRQAAIDRGIPVIHLVPDLQMAGGFTLIHNLPVDQSINQPIYSEIDDIALVLHTSGTTSRPKIVPLTHRNIYYSVQNIIEGYKLNPSDRCLNMMPLFHIHGLIGAVASSLIAGASVVCTPGFSTDQILNWFSQFAPTWYTAVPTIHQAVLEQAHRQPEVVRSARLRFLRSCSSPLSPQLAKELERTFEAPVLEAYGMTEAAHQIASNPLPPGTRKFGSVGKSTGTSRISIRDAGGNPLPPNGVGEICIQGENVTTGYENFPAANHDSYKLGWLATGDQGYLDDEGYLFIQGRLKEFINRAGEKISPCEIDEILMQHPAVKQAVAFAVPHATLGEDIAAAIVFKPGNQATRRELHQFSAERLAEFKIPRTIVFISEIPKGATGKIQRIGLYEKLQKELGETAEQEKSTVVSPRTLIEEKIFTIWTQVLEQRPIGIQDDFLSLGVDSIKIAQILMLVQKEFDVVISLKDFYFLPTIELMADYVKKLLEPVND
jgi:acyl-CoA synthetase (AMP-forming)/AMP-acid ligase II/acyl carrier protein